jgi:DNA replication protein DnaC
VNDLQHQRLAELSRELRLSAVPDLYSVIAQSAAAKPASFADFLEEILRAERDARRGRAREMFARVAGFPTVKTLDGFDFGFATGDPRSPSPCRRKRRLSPTEFTKGLEMTDEHRAPARFVPLNSLGCNQNPRNRSRQQP